jgi:hypothetical protein
LGKEAQPLQADPMVELLITRALRLAHDDVDLQLAAGELIRASGHDLHMLRSAHTEATTRFPEFGAGVWIGEAFAPLFAAIVSLEEEEAARKQSHQSRSAPRDRTG